MPGGGPVPGGVGARQIGQDVGPPGGGALPDPTDSTGAEGAATDTGAFTTTGSLVNVQELTNQDIQAIWDLVTAVPAALIEGRININTAPAEVLGAVIGPELAADIVNWRETRGPFPTVAHLLDMESMGPTKFEEIADLLTTRSYVFTIEASGQIRDTGITHRIRTMVDVSGDQPNYLLISHY